MGAPCPSGVCAGDDWADPQQEGHQTGFNLSKSVGQDLLQACGNSMAVTVVAAALTEVLWHLARAQAFAPLRPPPVLHDHEAHDEAVQKRRRLVTIRAEISRLVAQRLALR